MTAKPEVLVLYCGRTMAGKDSPPEGTVEAEGCRARFVMIPCSSTIVTLNLVKLMDSGLDGIVIVGCQGEDCRLSGNGRAESRARHACACLQEAGMGGERISVVRRGGLTVSDLKALAEERADALSELGENPLKTEGSA